MHRTLNILALACLVCRPAIAAPSEEIVVRSPGKPSHPLQVEVMLEKRLTAGVESEGKLVLRSSMPVHEMRVVLRPSPGVNALSDGVLERQIGLLRPGEPVELPLQVVSGGGDGGDLGIELRAVKADGRVISRSLELHLGEEPKRRDKMRLERQNGSVPGDSATVKAEQEITRGDR